MAKPKSPHAQSQQNTHFAQTDVNPGELEQTVGSQEDSEAYGQSNGAKTGGTRSPKHTPGAGSPHNTEPQAAAFEGDLTRRVFDDAGKQGISNKASSKEAEGQRNVVGERDNSQAGVNHSGKTPQQQ